MPAEWYSVYLCQSKTGQKSSSRPFKNWTQKSSFRMNPVFWFSNAYCTQVNVPFLWLRDFPRLQGLPDSLFADEPGGQEPWSLSLLLQRRGKWRWSWRIDQEHVCSKIKKCFISVMIRNQINLLGKWPLGYQSIN